MQLFNASARTQRLLIALSLGMATVYFAALVFMMGIFPPPAPDLSAAQVAEIYAHSNLKFRIGVALTIISGGFYLPWSMVIAVQMDRIEQRTSIWTMLQALTSAAGTWIFALPPLLWGAAAFNPGRSPEITALMHELAFLTFYCAASFFPFQLIAVALVSLSRNNLDPHTAFPRWLGWLTLWTGIVASEGFIGVMFNSGPFSWNGIFVFYLPVLFFTIWMIAMTVMMLRAIRLQQTQAAA
ncbi:MAG: hypothetical protein JWQ90_843 [Hydrocarboniphaga sp.]|uniref:hypothetical protein n=1 Tax=Hydrocarboniphaga sp. TaxID=2033016 RepID=UPI00262B1EC6|nr:hypothetical protein [Hydrocarboniphaga sp.]MDB5968393.1 hypothetical protein [Hydrocarboniphaga sp.]